jgi:hypothetical protein
MPFQLVQIYGSSIGLVERLINFFIDEGDKENEGELEKKSKTF